MFALGYIHEMNDHIDEDLELGADITKTCHESYDRQKTKIGPESFDMQAHREFQSLGGYYILRPGNSYYFLFISKSL